MDIKSFGAINAYQKNTTAPQEAQGRAVEKTATGGNQDPTKLEQTPETMKIEQQANLVAKLFGKGESLSQAAALKISFQSAIEEINKQLRLDLGLDESAADPISAENLQEQGGMEYWSPENTAQRIVQGTTAFISGFQNAHPELEGEALIDRFIEVVGGGISEGFEQAKSFLGDLNVLEGSIEENINQTYDLVQKGLENFRNEYLGLNNSTEAE